MPLRFVTGRFSGELCSSHRRTCFGWSRRMRAAKKGHVEPEVLLPSSLCMPGAELRSESTNSALFTYTELSRIKPPTELVHQRAWCAGHMHSYRDYGPLSCSSAAIAESRQTELVKHTANLCAGVALGGQKRAPPKKASGKKDSKKK
ncbi:hypothetical protein LSAT2_024174 [Lamellibrachia satsuma]|nr:hypothetical protein LSAT2_024174 [Lamellibrachia satsuma]